MPATSLPLAVADRGGTASGVEPADSPGAAELSPLLLAGFEFSLRTSSLDALDSLARTVGPEWVADGFERIAETEEAALVATCSRRELLLVVRTPAALSAWRERLEATGPPWQERSGRDVTGHLFQVAAGRESMVVGEREVRAQVRAAGHATLSRHRRRLLRDLFDAATDAADRIAPTVPSSCSIAAVAATKVLELTGRPFPRVLVVGSGAVGRAVTELLAPSARVTIAYRTSPPAEEFLRTTGARAVRAAGLAAEVALSDAVVTATKSGERTLGPSDLPPGRSVLLVDVGMPRNIDPGVRAVPGVRLLDLEDLRSDLRRPSDGREEQLLAAAADEEFARFASAAFEPWVAQLRRNAEFARRAELESARSHLGVLAPEQLAAVDRLTRRLTERLLQAPTQRLRGAPPGAEGDLLRRLALELWRPAASGP